jgi:hypothetical protein
MALASCGSGASSSRQVPTTPPRALPVTARALATRLTETEMALRRKIDAWRGGAQEPSPPPGLAAWARYEQRAIVALARRPRLAATVIRLLPRPLGPQISDLGAALRELDRLGEGEASGKLRVGRPRPLVELLGYYHRAERRFRVGWSVLAAVNMVETAFGRVRNASTAGARGPMQFEPATWRAYGLGGDVEDPHDAILGAARYLSASGAPGDYSRALQRYNPSPLYAGAVLHLSRAMLRDRDLVYDLYLWRP